MLTEYRELISELKKHPKDNQHFFNLFERHNDLDDKISNFYEHLTDIELKELKVEKLHLKDQIKDYLSKVKK